MSRDNTQGWIAFAVLFLVVLVYSCTIANQSPQDAIDVLTAHGFSDARVLDHSYLTQWNGCGGDDVVAYKCEAVNPAGKRVAVTVCAGWLKGGTIRVGGGA